MAIGQTLDPSYERTGVIDLVGVGYGEADDGSYLGMEGRWLLRCCCCCWTSVDGGARGGLDVRGFIIIARRDPAEFVCCTCSLSGRPTDLEGL